MITVGLLYPPLHSSSHSAEWQAASECDPAPIPNPTYFAVPFAGQVTKTKNYCTYAEVKYAYDHDIKILPIKMCEPETKPKYHTHILVSSAQPCQTTRRELWFQHAFTQNSDPQVQGMATETSTRLRHRWITGAQLGEDGAGRYYGVP